MKCTKDGVTYDELESLPVWGAWVEIVALKRGTWQTNVAPRVGSVG